MATIYRAYGRDDRGAHRLYTHWLTAGARRARRRRARAVRRWCLALHRLRDVEPVALHRPELRRADDVPAPGRRSTSRPTSGGGCTSRSSPRSSCCWRRSTPAPSAGSAGAVARPAAAERPRHRGRRRLTSSSLGGLTAFVPLARRAPRALALAPLTLFSTQALWFVLPVALSWAATLDRAPQTRYSSGMLAVMHSAQYLWITRYFARRDAEQRSARRRLERRGATGRR